MPARWIRGMKINNKQVYFIRDYSFWVLHEKELCDWLEANTEAGQDTQEGMVLSFANEEEEIMFILRWGQHD